MDIVKSEPKTFIEHVAETHVDQDLCPKADELRQNVVSAFRHARRQNDPNGNPIWVSKGKYTTRIKDKEITFTLTSPRLSRRKRDTESQTISVIANNDLLNPVALIFPAPDTEHACASVVIAGVVNDPDHLKEITPIIKAIERSSYPDMY